MYKGKPSKGIEFYNLLNQSEEFTSELGKVALASGRLEVEFILYLTKNNVEGNYKKATLGTLIRIANENKLLSENENLIFKQISKQRNYITHNIYALFSDLIDETIMEKEKLLDSDVHLYTERAWQLRDNLNGLSDVIKTKRKK
jgi:hypothetical protein